MRTTTSVDNRIPELGHNVIGFTKRFRIAVVVVVSWLDGERRRTPEDDQAVKRRGSATLSEAIGDVLITRKAVARGVAKLCRDRKRIRVTT